MTTQPSITGTETTGELLSLRRSMIKERRLRKAVALVRDACAAAGTIQKTDAISSKIA